MNNQTKKNKELSIKLKKKLKQEFEKVIDNPTPKQIKRYRVIELALLTAWLSDTYSNYVKAINDAIKFGKDKALKQIVGKKLFDKSDMFSLISDAKKQQIKADLKRVVAGIQQNSRRNIEQIRKDEINGETKHKFIGTFRKYGIAFFLARNNARWSLDRYIIMSTETAIEDTERQAFMVKAQEYDNDLVQVIHVGNDEPCELCKPFNGKTLSISGKTKGYMTIAEAESYGLFHPNCHHVYKLNPDNPDKNIEISEENSKYNSRYYA